jgi:GT2 family glycosyltransferase
MMRISTSRSEHLDLSIIIVNYNTRKFLNECLLSIYNTIKKHQYEIIVVDNASSDDSVTFLKKQHPKAALIANNYNVGYAIANNQGIKIAQGRFILLLNPDTILYKSSIDKMVDHLKRFSDIGIVGPKVINPGNTLQWDSCGAFLTPSILLFKELGLEAIFPYSHLFGNRLLFYWDRNSSRVVDWVSGVCMLIRKKILHDTGLLDEQFFAYMEDMDLCRRATKTNWKVVFISNVEIFHNLSRSWRQHTAEQLLMSFDSEKRYLEKHHGLFGLFIFRISHFIGSFLRLFIHILRRDRRKVQDHYQILKWVVRDVL